MSSAKITFFGAAGEVTGSSYMLEANGSKVLVDCGLHQGIDADRRNEEPFDFAPSDIDAVILTHAHIDHSGRLPQLVKHGFKGRIWATDPTIDLATVLLRDTARLMAEEAEWRSRKNSRKGLPPVKPAYTERDVDETIKRFHYVRYDERAEIAPSVAARYRDAGHIVGASIVEAWLGHDGDPVKIVFSGDIGPRQTVIEKPPTVVEDADYVVIESTYGDRNHRSLEETRDEFRSEMETAIRAGGKILIPTFVVDRAQRILYEILRLQRTHGFPRIPDIYFDSPMGTKATQIYEKYMPMLSREMQEHVRDGRNPFAPTGLSYTASVDESRAINDIPHAIVLAGSGMCTGGRIVHHLKHNLWNPTCHVFFVGYQAKGTLGRRLVDGEKNLRIAGEDVVVEAKLHTIGGFSAHGDRDDLLSWASHFGRRAAFFVTHGEPRSSGALASGIREMGYRATAPGAGMTFELTGKDQIVPTAPSFAVRKETADRAEILALLQEIASETESLRENLDAAPEAKDLANLLPLLESSRLILNSAKNLSL